MPELIIDDVAVERVDEYRYLGTVLDNNLTFDRNVDYNGRYAMPKKNKNKKEEEEKGKADLTTVLHIRELPHLHVKLAVWFSFPTTNNKNPMNPP